MTRSEQMSEELAKAMAFAKERGLTLEEATQECASLMYRCMEMGFDLTRSQLWKIVGFLQNAIHFLYEEKEIRSKVRVFFTLERLIDGIAEYKPMQDEPVLRGLCERAFSHVY